MVTIQGRISHLRVYREEGGGDPALSFSKVLWSILWCLFPIAVFRFFYSLFGIPEAVIATILLLLLGKLLGGPFHLVMWDELLSRLVPALRSGVRMGYVWAYEFRVHPSQGPPMDCKLKGGLKGAGPVVGDFFELEGRETNGALEIRRGTNLVTGAALEPHRLRSGLILLVSISLLVLMILYLFGVFDSAIYEVLYRILI